MASKFQFRWTEFGFGAKVCTLSWLMASKFQFRWTEFGFGAGFFWPRRATSFLRVSIPLDGIWFWSGKGVSERHGTSIRFNSVGRNLVLELETSLTYANLHIVCFNSVGRNLVLERDFFGHVGPPPFCEFQFRWTEFGFGA